MNDHCGSRRHTRSAWLVALLALTIGLLGLAGQPAGASTPQPAPQDVVATPLHTEGRLIVDARGHHVHLATVNWYGAESEDFVVAGLQSQQIDAIAEQIRMLGFNGVRLPWSNELVERNPVVPDYAVAANPSLHGMRAMAVFDRVVDSLTRHKLMVILDNHNSDAEWCCGKDGNDLWYNDRFPESAWLADWSMMALRYRHNPLVVGADLRNEPRERATWGGPAETDWHAAAERGGNAVLAANPHLLVFVEGTGYAGDLSGVKTLPVDLAVPNQLVYEAHDYAWFESHSSFDDWYSHITPKWGYLVTGSDPKPLWIGEFGTCSTDDSCVHSSDPNQNGSWFDALTTYMGTYDVDWAYWAVNGTQSTGAGRTWGDTETYGILDSDWKGIASATLTHSLQQLQ